MPEVLDAKGAAKLLKCCRNTIYQRVSKAEIPFHYLPGTRLVRFLDTELLDWVATSQPPKPIPRVRRKEDGWSSVTFED